ncbi:STAS domain-containing protein [Micromonospora sp. NPDC049101]|uniref:STAS domain-containing protein n=1 Tax=unclassified Micromonospora TaxID=2617518 RepID=UPI0033F96BA2
MSLDTRMIVEADVATLVLVGEADAESAPDLHRLVTDATRSPLRQLTLDVTGLTYLSSAGLRCLVYAHQRLGRGVRIVLVGANDEVAETIRLTGFDRSIELRPELG